MNIEIDGKPYELNVTLATKIGALKPAYTPKKVGDHFRSPCNNHIFLLASVDTYKVSLINIVNGHRRAPVPVPVSDYFCINEQEWQDLCSPHHLGALVPITLGTINSTDK